MELIYPKKTDRVFDIIIHYDRQDPLIDLHHGLTQQESAKVLPFLNLNLDLHGKKDGTSEIRIPPKGASPNFSPLFRQCMNRSD